MCACMRAVCWHYCMCVVVGALYVCASHCACVCSTPERLSSLSSEATGVQSVCFHTPLLRYNGSHFFFFCLPSFSAVCASSSSSSSSSSLSFCLFSPSLLPHLCKSFPVLSFFSFYSTSTPPHPHLFLISTSAAVGCFLLSVIVNNRHTESENIHTQPSLVNSHLNFSLD